MLHDDSSPLTTAARDALRAESAPPTLRARILDAAARRVRARRVGSLRLAAAGILGMLCYGAMHAAMTSPASPFVVKRQARLDVPEDSRAFLRQAMPLLADDHAFAENGGVPTVFRIADEAGEGPGAEDLR